MVNEKLTKYVCTFCNIVFKRKWKKIKSNCPKCKDNLHVVTLDSIFKKLEPVKEEKEKFIEHNFNLSSYENEWNAFKKEFKLTEAQAIEQIRSELQLIAWSDIIVKRADFLRGEKNDDKKRF